MPPGPAYNWLCVLASTAKIISHAAQYKAAQMTPKAVGAYLHPRKRRRTEDAEVYRGCDGTGLQQPWRQDFVIPSELSPVTNDSQREPSEQLGVKSVDRAVNIPHKALHASPKSEAVANMPENPTNALSSMSSAPSELSEIKEVDLPVSRNHGLEVPIKSQVTDASSNADNSHISQPLVAASVETTTPLEVSLPIEEVDMQSPTEAQVYQHPTRNLQSSKVPSSRIGRLFHYGGLAASLGYGAASEVLRRTGGGGENSSSVMMTEANVRRLVSKLSQMRGAALKLGQFMSIQDTHILPAEIDKIFRRVQDSAHYMPDWQMEQAMSLALGPSWLANFISFDRIPFAAASIGQVHTAVLAAAVSPTGRDERVAVKVQFPNIASSIESDLGYIKILLTAGKLLPRGLFLDKTIQAMKAELADECDYVREATFLRRFASTEFLGDDARFKVPWVWDGSTATVLVMERVDGVSVGEANALQISEQDRMDISARVIELCLKELFEFRTMQTDPNWTNFLWNSKTRQIELVDFGATRTYSKDFMDDWFTILQAATQGNRQACIDASLKIGYLTGEENKVMLDAHVTSMTLLAMPFKSDTPQPFSFGPGSQWGVITAAIRAQIPVMLQHRLTPPPKETYSLNRKLSGSFLLASRLGASVDTKAIWDKIVGKYRPGDV